MRIFCCVVNCAVLLGQNMEDPYLYWSFLVQCLSVAHNLLRETYTQNGPGFDTCLDFAQEALIAIFPYVTVDIHVRSK